MTMAGSEPIWTMKVREMLDGDIQVSIDNGYWLGPTQLDRFAEYFARVLDALQSLRDDE